MDNLTLFQQNPSPQCAVCRTNDFASLDKVCHRCGRALCKVHPGADPPDFKRFGDIEFSGLDLRGAAQRVVYCQACASQISGWRQLWREITATLHQWVLKLLLFGSQRPPVPAIPAIRRIAMSEELSGQYTLKPDGELDPNQGAEAKGKLTVDVDFAEHDRARLAAYRGKYLILKKRPLVSHAGFIQLKDIANLTWEPSKDDNHPQPSLSVLRKPITELPFFTGKPPNTGNNCQYVLAYTVKRSDGKSIPLPLQIVPCLVEDHDQRALELDIQLRADAEKYIKFETARVKEFQLEIPGAIGGISAITPLPTKPPIFANLAAKPAVTSHSLTWTALKPLSKDNPLVSIRLGLQTEMQPAVTLTGTLVVSFDGTLSGSQEMRYYTSWGQLANAPELQRATEVKVEFSLSLQSLAQQKLTRRSKRVSCVGTCLTADLIADLTERLSEEGLYIRRVVEEPARPSRSDAEELHLVWDIAARQYDTGLHPLDVHLALTGTTIADRPERNELSVECTVQGSGPINGARQGQVESLLSKLTTIVETVCQFNQLERTRQNIRRQQERWNGAPDFN